MKKSVKIALILSLLGNCTIFYVGYKAYEYRTHINHFLEKYRHVSQEFSARNSYQTVNSQIVSDTTNSNRVVFFGTQTTKKYDLKKYYPEYEAINRGVNGQRVAGYLLRFKQDVLDLAPKAVVLEISSYNFRPENSIKEIQDYTELLAQLSSYNDIVPILTTVIKPKKEFSATTDLKEFGEYNLFDSVDVYNTWLRNYTDKYQYNLVDVSKLLGDSNGYLRKNYALNLVEPNAKGYNILTIEIKNERYTILLRAA